MTWVRLLLLFSGAAALVFQTLWVKQLTLVVGVEVHAVAVAVAAFFCGLAGGAAVVGRLIDRGGRPLLWYAALETAVAITGLATTLVLPHSPPLFVSLEQRVGVLAWLLPTLLVAIPAFFMGGTLPAAMKWVRPLDAGLGSAAGRLYAWNTYGAIGGALLGPFLLLPWLGVRGTGLAAALICALTAAIAWWLERFTESRDAQACRKGRGASTLSTAAPRRIALALGLSACAGGVA
ncbi:MAG TPA: fused MFS/spermidine synthase, partial [Steroidobacteraceae bacterium]|nr:fused MFS/spermidine synthase [Steroidobacteraceae bacterium]